MWVRGLKLGGKSKKLASSLSHPMWVRGLKLAFSAKKDGVKAVAPHVGAWIETVMSAPLSPIFLRRTPCGCVD